MRPLKPVVASVLAPLLRLQRRVGGSATRMLSFAKLGAALDGMPDASVVVLGAPEVHGSGRVRFGRDVLAILDDLNIEKVHWCGLSMGGMVGQWLGANAPQRLDRIILANTACHYPDPTNWLNRIKTVKDSGLAAIADAVIASWLSADFREREPQITANMKAMLLAAPVQGYLACCEALSTLDQRDLLGRITNPTLVIAGRDDLATPVAAAEFIRDRIAGAGMTILDAAHISNIEQPQAFTVAVIGFLTQP